MSGETIMGRQPRPIGEGFTYHLMARGNNRRRIFADELDRRSFLGRVDAVARQRKWSVHAWCLMGNHFHLLLTTPMPDLSDGMRDLLGAYARRHNYFSERTGHLFSGRFRAVVVGSETQLLNTFRYICHNPSRAGLAHGYMDYPWTSYATRGMQVPPIRLDEHALLSVLHPNPTMAGRMLRDLVENPTTPSRAGSVRPALHTIIAVLGVGAGVAAAVGLGYTHAEVAEVIGLSRSAVSQRLRRAA